MPSYERGDYVKVEFQDENTVISELMWVRVHRCDDEKKLVFGTLRNEPVNDYDGQACFEERTQPEKQGQGQVYST